MLVSFTWIGFLSLPVSIGIPLLAMSLDVLCWYRLRFSGVELLLVPDVVFSSGGVLVWGRHVLQYGPTIAVPASKEYQCSESRPTTSST